MADMKDKSEARKARVARVMGISCSHGGRMKCNEGCYSKGGEIGSKGGPTSIREKMDYRATGTGVHESNHEGPGSSTAGSFARAAHKGNTSLPKDTLQGGAKEEHHRVLGEMKSDKGDRRNLAEGGALEGMDSEPMPDPDNDGDAGDHELMEACADELMEALEKKDKRGIVDAIRALVLNSKE